MGNRKTERTHAVTYRRRVSRRVISTDTIDIDAMTVTVIRKPIRNMYLRVQPPNGDIQVTAPARISTGQIVTFVHAREDWIRAQQHKIQHMQRETRHLVDAVDEDDKRIATGERLPSETQTETQTNGLPEQTSHSGDGGQQNPDGHLPGSGHADATVWTDEVQRYARHTLEQRLPTLLDHWTRVIGRSPTRITFRIMRSRWGSCTPATGRIRLNLQLGLMEPRFLEYVLVHEMTHLWVGGHGPRFQQLMDRFLPGWRDLRRELNRYAVL